jgi:hypothetical protein
MTTCEGARFEGLRLLRTRLLLSIAVLVAAVGCGDSPFESIGERSSEWINEPTVPTTQPVVTTTPTVVTVDQLLWANDEIDSVDLGDADAVLASVFARRQGDRFVQASRFEIAVALAEVAFPGEAPTGAQWVSSQLVFENDGTVSAEPSAAFGIWSAEPYTRSRSVAQMVVLKISTDLEAAAELAAGEVSPSCARFADRTTEACEILTIGARDTWLLGAAGGSTLIWFEGPYRYELFGRSFVPVSVLREMSASMVPLASIGAVSS